MNALGSGVKNFLWRTWRIIRWPILLCLVVYFATFLYFLANLPKKTVETVAAIHAQRLTMEDVDGKHLPPAPDPKLVDATVEGVDANKNGIRDDVELAIFKKYPNDIKIRAAELQYASAIQMYLTRDLNSEMLIAVAQEEERASSCIAEQFSRVDIQKYYSAVRMEETNIKHLTINTNARKAKASENTKVTRSFGSLEGDHCDVNEKQNSV